MAAITEWPRTPRRSHTASSPPTCMRCRRFSCLCSAQRRAAACLRRARPLWLGAHHSHGGSDAGSLASLASAGDVRVSVEAFSDIAYASTTPPELAAAAPRVCDLVGHIACALQLTGVLGSDLADYRWSVATRI